MLWAKARGLTAVLSLLSLQNAGTAVTDQGREKTLSEKVVPAPKPGFVSCSNSSSTNSIASERGRGGGLVCGTEAWLRHEASLCSQGIWGPAVLRGCLLGQPCCSEGMALANVDWSVN